MEREQLLVQIAEMTSNIKYLMDENAELREKNKLLFEMVKELRTLLEDMHAWRSGNPSSK